MNLSVSNKLVLKNASCPFRSSAEQESCRSFQGFPWLIYGFAMTLLWLCYDFTTRTP